MYEMTVSLVWTGFLGLTIVGVGLTMREFTGKLARQSLRPIRMPANGVATSRGGLGPRRHSA